MDCEQGQEALRVGAPTPVARCNTRKPIAHGNFVISEAMLNAKADVPAAFPGRGRSLEPSINVQVNPILSRSTPFPQSLR